MLPIILWLQLLLRRSFHFCKGGENVGRAFMRCSMTPTRFKWAEALC